MALKKKSQEEKGPRLGDYGVLLKPVITEKSSTVGSQGGGVVFRVARTASKDEIKAAIERVFKVKVSAVRTCNYIGKKKRTKSSLGKRAAFKKAYVTLKEGQTIDLVEGL